MAQTLSRSAASETSFFKKKPPPLIWVLLWQYNEVCSLLLLLASVFSFRGVCVFCAVFRALGEINI